MSCGNNALNIAMGDEGEQSRYLQLEFMHLQV